MNCPFCGNEDQRVLDSRSARSGQAIRRRRECAECRRRYTTFEEFERPHLVVVKKDGSREDFDREKLLRGILTACRKRPVPMEVMRDVVYRIERDLYDLLVHEVATAEIGERVLAEIAKVDSVAFVRFASVYRDFSNPQEFIAFVQSIQGPLPAGESECSCQSTYTHVR